MMDTNPSMNISSLEIKVDTDIWFPHVPMLKAGRSSWEWKWIYNSFPLWYGLPVTHRNSSFNSGVSECVCVGGGEREKRGGSRCCHYNSNWSVLSTYRCEMYYIIQFVPFSLSCCIVFFHVAFNSLLFWAQILIKVEDCNDITGSACIWGDK